MTDPRFPVPEPASGVGSAAPSRHIALLSNYARTASYREVLAKHAPDKVVAEIGCGSGVLACFAARAGARRVYAIEQASVIGTAREIADVNGLSDRIVFIPGHSLDVELPERADLVYAEVISSDALSQHVPPYYRDARRRFLAPGGRVIPQSLAINAVCVESAAVAEFHYLGQQSIRRAKRLGELYGLELSPLVHAYEAEMRTARDSYAALEMERLTGPFTDDQRTPRTKILTDEVEIARFELSVDEEEQPLRVPLEFGVTASGTHNAVAISFTAQLDNEIVLSTSPFSSQLLPSWGQVVRPVAPAAGQQREPVVAPGSHRPLHRRSSPCRVEPAGADEHRLRFPDRDHRRPTRRPRPRQPEAT